jgi:hypothetical protein
MVGQFSVEVNRKDAPGLCRASLLPSSKPAKMRAFYSGANSEVAWDDFGRMLMGFEGWQFRLHLHDKSEEV